MACRASYGVFGLTCNADVGASMPGADTTTVCPGDTFLVEIAIVEEMYG